MKCGCGVCKIAGLLVVIGAVNWGLVGALNFNVVTTVLGEGSSVTRVVYVLIGLAGVMKLISCFKDCPKCTT